MLRQILTAHHKSPLAAALTIAGTIPFVATAAGSLFGLVAADGLWLRALIAYSGLITAFICGIHWGLFMADDGEDHDAFGENGLSVKKRLNLYMTSNGVTLIAWAAMILPGLPKLTLLAHGGCLMTLFLIDTQLKQEEHISAGFLILRGVATALVMAALIVMIAKI